VVALAWGASVFLWTGDFKQAEEHIDATIYQAASNAMGPFVAVGRARKAELAIRRGDATNGVAALRACLETIHAVGSELLTTEFNISLLQGLAAAGQFAEGLAVADQAIRRVATNGDDVYMPELLRAKGKLLVGMAQHAGEDAEVCFTRSLELSRRQGARAWALRAATDLAALLADTGRAKIARKLLRPVLDPFVEGLDTPDLVAAKRQLSRLS
jgi:predicted ATPase